LAAGCQVDFYVLAGRAAGPGEFACRLCLMAWEQGHRISVVADGAAAAGELDELMWSFPPGRFLPHALGPGDAAAAVCIVPVAGELPADREVVLNLGTEPVPEPARFRRLLEVVPADPRMRNASRLKYRHYRELGLEPVTHANQA
jgi:DNA polymerase-3 subunit chi